MTLEEIALRLSLTRERVRQIELGAIKKLRARLHAEESEREAAASGPGSRRPARIAA